MPRLLIRLLFVACFTACTRQTDLPDVVVTAGSPGEFTQFRTELGILFPAERLKDLDTATQELQLAAMDRGVATSADREADMVRTASGKTVRAVTLLGWQARKARFLREITDMQKLLDADLAQQARTAAAGTPESVSRRIGSEREVLAKLHDNLAATEQRLAELSKP